MTVDIDLINNCENRIEYIHNYSVCLQSMDFYFEREDPRGWTRCVLTVVRHLAGKCPIDQTKSLTQEKWTNSAFCYSLRSWWEARPQGSLSIFADSHPWVEDEWHDGAPSIQLMFWYNVRDASIVWYWFSRCSTCFIRFFWSVLQSIGYSEWIISDIHTHFHVQCTTLGSMLCTLFPAWSLWFVCICASTSHLHLLLMSFCHAGIGCGHLHLCQPSIRVFCSVLFLWSVSVWLKFNLKSFLLIRQPQSLNSNQAPSHNSSKKKNYLLIGGNLQQDQASYKGPVSRRWWSGKGFDHHPWSL